MSRPRDALPLFVLICAVGLGVFGWTLWQSKEEGAERVHYEDLALARLHLLEAAQKTYHQQQGRYGWVEDLEGADLLSDFGIEKDTEAMTGGMLYLTSPRYRLDVMLPFQITRTGQVRIGLRSEGKRNADLEEDHFVIVARPWGDLESGLRTFLIDESGQVYVSEGVSDKEALRTRALPELHPSIAGVIVTGGMRLYPIDNLPKR